jgi:hypothetical protein
MFKSLLAQFLVLLLFSLPAVAAEDTAKLAEQASLRDADKSAQARAALLAEAVGGDAEAEEALGNIIGSSEAPNDVEATKWYRKAAEQGRAWAQYKIGEAYECGCGVTQDYAEAYFWSILAARQAPPSREVFSYVDARDRIAQRLTPEQKAKVDMRVKKWLKSHPAGPEWTPPPRIKLSPTTWLH